MYEIRKVGLLGRGQQCGLAGCHDGYPNSGHWLLVVCSTGIYVFTVNFVLPNLRFVTVRLKFVLQGVCYWFEFINVISTLSKTLNLGRVKVFVNTVYQRPFTKRRNWHFEIFEKSKFLESAPKCRFKQT